MVYEYSLIFTVQAIKGYVLYFIVFSFYKFKSLLIYLKILHRNFSNQADIFLNDNVVIDENIRIDTII